jgi:hypothetical protein
MDSLLQRLGPEYVAAAARVEQLYARECVQITGDLSITLNPLPVGLYHCLPWLFSDVFPEVTDEDCCVVAVAGLLYFGHMLTLDRALDGDREPDMNELLAAAFMHERALTLLFPLLPQDTPAWEGLARYKREYAGSVILEAEHRGQLRQFPVERFARISKGKSAVLKASPWMLACLAGDPQRMRRIEAAMDSFSLALQVEDDLQDWRSDYTAGLYSYVLTSAIRAGGLVELVAQGQRPSCEHVGHSLFYSGVASDALSLAIESCEASVAEAKVAGAFRFSQMVCLLGEHLQDMSRKFDHLRQRAARAAGDRLERASIGEALERLVDRLVQEHRDGYREAWHKIRFPHELGFTAADECVQGEVFQRAVLGWLYVELESFAPTVLSAVLEENLDVLADKRLVGEGGGWSYFPMLPELPPDADDLAQVLHAFLARPNRNLPRLFDRPVELVLNHHRREDGSIETWIIDPAAEPSRQKRYRDAVERWWGRSVDSEVVANFFSALKRWRPERYRSQIGVGADYVARQQRQDGSWEGTWYVGPYYSTYVCCRLLVQVSPEHVALRRAEEFLRRTQRPDGGWGATAVSRPLSTALALLGLLLLERGARQPSEAVTRAARYLLLTQDADGLWKSGDFVQMDLSRGRPGAPARFLTYSSRTMTAAFAGAALLGFSRFSE